VTIKLVISALLSGSLKVLGVLVETYFVASGSENFPI
jgi:hypothetical protein